MDELVKQKMYKNICDSNIETKTNENYVKYRHEPMVQCCNKDLCNYNIVIPSNRSLNKPGEITVVYTCDRNEKTEIVINEIHPSLHDLDNHLYLH
jgi:hypothetical protein